MNITTASPAEIDRQIARINSEIADQESIATSKRSTIRQQDEAIVKIDELTAQGLPFFNEFEVRGGWARYFLVEGGHLHYDVSSHRCSRQLDTNHYWLTDRSGSSPAEVIELAGDRVCTVCFSDAPVAVRSRPSVLFTATEREAAVARQEREDARTAKAVKAAANEITDIDGSPLRTRFDILRTIRSAEIFYRDAATELAYLGDLALYSLSRGVNQTEGDHEEMRLRRIECVIGDATKVLAALAYRKGVMIESEFASHAAKVAAKVKKDAKDAAQMRAMNPTYFANA